MRVQLDLLIEAPEGVTSEQVSAFLSEAARKIEGLQPGEMLLCGNHPDTANVATIRRPHDKNPPPAVAAAKGLKSWQIK